MHNWEAYNGTAYGPVFAKTARYKERWLQSPRNFKAPEDVAVCCWKVCCQRRPGNLAMHLIRQELALAVPQQRMDVDLSSCACSAGVQAHQQQQ